MPPAGKKAVSAPLAGDPRSGSIERMCDVQKVSLHWACQEGPMVQTGDRLRFRAPVAAQFSPVCDQPRDSVSACLLALDVGSSDTAAGRCHPLIQHDVRIGRWPSLCLRRQTRSQFGETWQRARAMQLTGKTLRCIGERRKGGHENRSEQELRGAAAQHLSGQTHHRDGSRYRSSFSGTVSSAAKIKCSKNRIIASPR